ILLHTAAGVRALGLRSVMLGGDCWCLVAGRSTTPTISAGALRCWIGTAGSAGYAGHGAWVRRRRRTTSLTWPTVVLGWTSRTAVLPASPATRVDQPARSTVRAGGGLRL